MPTISLFVALWALSPLAQTGTTPTARKPAVLEIRVTDRMGAPLDGADVAAEGPLGRKGATDRNGSLTFKSLTAGTYRFRIERQGYVPLEKEVVVRAGAMESVEAALSAAPPPPPEPKPAPPPPPVVVAPPPLPVGQPRALSIPELFEKQPLGRDALKESAIGCSGASAATVMQLRDGLTVHKHADADEMLYVVGGEALLKLGDKDFIIAAGWFVLVPRGTDHVLTRRGRNPVYLLSVLNGPPCK